MKQDTVAAFKGTWQRPQGDFHHPFYLDCDGCLLGSPDMLPVSPTPEPPQISAGIHLSQNIPETPTHRCDSATSNNPDGSSHGSNTASSSGDSVFGDPQRRTNCLQVSSINSTPLCNRQIFFSKFYHTRAWKNNVGNKTSVEAHCRKLSLEQGWVHASGTPLSPALKLVDIRGPKTRKAGLFNY